MLLEIFLLSTAFYASYWLQIMCSFVAFSYCHNCQATNVDRNHMIKYFSKIIPEIDSSRLDSFSNEILEVVYFCLSPAASTRPTVGVW